jgi:hypothetical protein
VALLYRYFRASDPAQRQQIKLVVFSLAVIVPPLGVAVALFGSGMFGTDTLAERFGLFMWTTFMVIFPLSIAVSILRYRLWDIDVVIRKTLVYSLLTAMLALVYGGSVLVLQAVFGRAVGGQSPIIIVLSTLVIAGLFGPLRRRLQELIDRRFFRRKYDAQQVLAHFAQTAREETGVDELSAELARVVEETVRP